MTCNAVWSGIQKGVSVTDLARVFNKATKQLYFCLSCYLSLSRHFSTNDTMLCYQHVSSDIFTDTFLASVPSTRHRKCVQVFCTDFCYFYVNAMEMKCDIPKAVKRLFKEVGVPLNSICNPAPEQVQGDTRNLCGEANCTIRQLEKGTQ